MLSPQTLSGCLGRLVIRRPGRAALALARALTILAGTLSLVAASGCSGGRTEISTGAGGSAGVGTVVAIRGTGGTGIGSGAADAGIGGASTGGAGTVGAVGAGGGAGGGGGVSSDPFASCTWTLGTGKAFAGSAPTGDNSADIGGPAIGDIPFTASTARRAVSVKVGTTLAGLTVGQAYLTRNTSIADTDVTIPVTNGGTDYPCFVTAHSLHYLSTAGTILYSADDPLYLSGSVGDLGGTFYTNTCLAPGETGYLRDVGRAAFFSGAASVELDLAASSSGKAPTGHLNPTQYEIGTCGATRYLRLSAVNSGRTTISVGADVRFGPGVLLDADGLPAGWILLEDDPAAQLRPGETAYFLTDLPDVAAVTRARFFVNFDPPAPSAAPDASTDAAPDAGADAGAD